MKTRCGRWFAGTAVMCFVVVCGATRAQDGAGQGSQQASGQDRRYLKESAEDSNFEIKTGQLALERSSSQDVKNYATMVIHDHEQLEKETQQAGKAVGEPQVPVDHLDAKDQKEFDRLGSLQDDTFDREYIKDLVKGNKESLKREKDETSHGKAEAVKTLAAHQAEADQKHTEAGLQLAQAHHLK